MTTPLLLVKPLRDHLTGLLNKVDPASDQKIIQSIIDCSLFLLIELEQLDRIGGLQ